MESPQRLLEETLMKRHGRKLARLLIENLLQDGLIDDILQILSKIDLIKELFNTYSDIAPKIIAEYKASREAVHQRLLQLLDNMAEDPFYNRKILANRSVLLSGSIRRYREKIVSIAELLESVLIDIEKDLLLELKTRAKTVYRKLEEIEELLEEINVKRSTFSSLEKGTQFLNNMNRSIHLNARELIKSLEELNKIDSEFSKLLENLTSCLKILKETKQLLNNNRSMIKRIKETYRFIKRRGMEAPFVEKFIKKNSSLLKSIEEREVKTEIAEVKERIIALKVMRKELTEHLEVIDQMKNFVDCLKKVEKELPRVMKICLIMDSMTRNCIFEKTYYELVGRLNSVRQELVVNSRDQFYKKKIELSVVEGLITKIIDIGELVKEISKADQELRSLADIEKWREEVARIVGTKASTNKVEAVLLYLKDINEKLEIWKKKLEDAKKMYPIWKKRVIEELSSEKEISIRQMRIPQEWRNWVIDRMKKEGVIEERDGRLFLAVDLPTIKGKKE